MVEDLLAGLSPFERAAAIAQLKADNATFPPQLIKLDPSKWPPIPVRGIAEVWRSSSFLLQVYLDREHTRLSVCRTEIDGPRFRAEIAWDDLMMLKRECGRGDLCAIEIYPPEAEVVNVANMRHLWIVDPPPFMWKKRR